MILDRDLPLDLLDVALRIAVSESPWTDKQKLLTVALRDHVTAQEATGKTKKCLTHVWINPPAAASEMIAWAREHPHLAPDRRLLHLGAVLATFQFVGSIAAIVGRAFALDGEVDPAEVRRRARGLWGDRSTVDVGARKAYTTFVRLGVVDGGGRLPLTRGTVLAANADMSAWLIHSLMLSRGVSSVYDSELSSVPELFWTRLSRTDTEYPLLERHNEGGSRVIWTSRYR
jgi:hypothetical protein